MTGSKKYLNNSKWDNEANQYYYENKSAGEYMWIEEKESIEKKLEIIDQFDLGGSCIWVLDSETSDVWSAFSKK